MFDTDLKGLSRIERANACNSVSPLLLPLFGHTALECVYPLNAFYAFFCLFLQGDKTTHEERIHSGILKRQEVDVCVLHSEQTEPHIHEQDVC